MLLSAATVAVLAATAAPGKLALPLGDGIAVVGDDFAAAPVVVVAKADSPAWSPDGTRLAYVRDARLEVAAADGTGARVLDAVEGGGSIGEVTWTPDGRELLYRRVGQGGGGAGVYAIAADGASARRPFLSPARAAAGRPRFVAGGTRVVFDAEGDLWGARADGHGARRLVTGPGADELKPRPDGTSYVASDRAGIVVLRPGGTAAGAGARVLTRLPGTARRSPLALAPDGVRLLATVTDASGDRASGTDLVDLTGAAPPRRVGGVDADDVPVLGFAGPFGPSWWSPPPATPPAPAITPAPDRRPPALVLRSDRDAFVVPVVAGARRVPVLRGQTDLSLLALDQTGVRRLSVAWVRAGARPRWRDASGPEGFWDTMPRRHGTYRLLLRATDVLGQATKQPREVIVKLAP